MRVRVRVRVSVRQQAHLVPAEEPVLVLVDTAEHPPNATALFEHLGELGLRPRDLALADARFPLLDIDGDVPLLDGPLALKACDVLCEGEGVGRGTGEGKG